MLIIILITLLEVIFRFFANITRVTNKLGLLYVYSTVQFPLLTVLTMT